MTLETGSLDYSNIKDKDKSYNVGGGVDGGQTSSKANANYEFSDKKQTNFATIGEGNIIITDSDASAGSATTLDKLNRDLTVAQYNTKEGGLKGGFTIDDATLEFMSNPEKLVTDTLDSLKQGYYDAKDTTKVIVKETAEAAEKTGNLVVSGHFTTDDKVQYFLNMDDYEDKKAEGVEMSSLDTLVYYKSKSAAGLELTAADKADLSVNAGVVIDDATDGILQNIKNNIQTSTREELLRDLMVLGALDKEDSKAAQSWLASVREKEQKSAILTNTDVASANSINGIIYEENSGKNKGIRDILEDWGQSLNSWGIEKNKEITNSSIVQNTHAAGEWMNEHPDQVLSTVTDFMPIIGQGKGVLDAITGTDIVTGEDLEGWQRGLGLASVIPIGKVADKVGDVLKHADDVEDSVSIFKNKLLNDYNPIEIDLSKVSKNDLHSTQKIMADFLDGIDTKNEQKFITTFEKLSEMKNTTKGREQLQIIHQQTSVLLEGANSNKSIRTLKKLQEISGGGLWFPSEK